MNTQYKILDLTEDLYKKGYGSLTDALTMIDPNENYYDSEMSGLDAYERQLHRFNIKVSGNGCGKVSDFFERESTRILFPEFVRRSIEFPIRNGIWENIFADISKGSINYNENCLFLDDFDALMINIPSYPILKTLRIDNHAVKMLANQTFSSMLHSIGKNIFNEIISDAVKLLCIIGKENRVMNHVMAYNSDAIHDTLSYSTLLNFWAKMKNRNMNTIICSPNTLSKILSFDEMKYCVSGYFNGMIRTPFGVTLIKDSDMSDDIVVGIDSSSAIQAELSLVKIANLDELITGDFEKIDISVSFSITSIDTNAVSIMYI